MSIVAEKDFDQADGKEIEIILADDILLSIKAQFCKKGAISHDESTFLVLGEEADIQQGVKQAKHFGAGFQPV